MYAKYFWPYFQMPLSVAVNVQYYTVINWVRGQQFCLTWEQIWSHRATYTFKGQTKLRPSNARIGTTSRHCDVKITWLIEPMKIRQSVNISIAGNKSMICWPVNRTFLQLIGILLLTAKMLYCFYIGENMMVYNKTLYVIHV